LPRAPGQAMRTHETTATNQRTTWLTTCL